jgi:hypothetical protein
LAGLKPVLKLPHRETITKETMPLSMAGQQFYLANATLVAVLFAYFNAPIHHIEDGRNRQFAAIDQRFGNVSHLWRAELHSVEGVLDARLKYIEEGYCA